MAETGLMLRRACGLAGQSPNSKEPEPCPQSQSRLDGSMTGQREGNDYQGTGHAVSRWPSLGGSADLRLVNTSTAEGGKEQTAQE